MQFLKLSVTLFLLFLSSLIMAENGFIRGTVFDDATGDALVGVSIQVVGTTSGTISDLDGKFNLKLQPGTYNLKVTFVTYEPLTLKSVHVKSGEVTLLDELRLKEMTIELGEAIITAERVRNTENSLLALKRVSPNVLDGISSANLKKTGDSDAASSMKRVPGVSVTAGKYIYIRGLGDRYTKTVLNGVDIPGLDPDRNTMQMDIFPSNIIDNIIIHKSFTADLPADFTGGIVDIALQDFPEKKKGSFSVSAGYNPGVHFNNEYLTYNGGKTDFLGYDDGTRSIPATSNIPLFGQAYVDPAGEAGTRYRSILGSFNPVMAAHQKMSIMDYGFGVSLGNQIVHQKITLGYSFAFSYKSTTEFYNNAEYGRYGLSGNSGETELEVREFQMGDYGSHSVLLSGMAGFAIKTINSKYRFNLLHLQNGETKAGIFDYASTDQGSEFSGFQHNLEYGERSLTNLLLEGKHSLSKSKWDIEWKMAPTLSKMNDPDIRFTRYVGTPGNYVIGTESGFPERIWRELQEYNLAGVLNFSKEFRLYNKSAKIRFGVSYSYKERDFTIYNFAFNIRNINLTGNPDELFQPENLWPLAGDVTSGTTYEAPFIPNNPNKFNADASNAAGYISAEFSPFNRFKAILGTRLENYMQNYTGTNQLHTVFYDHERVINDLNLFYSINLVYMITDKQNIRFSYATTIARPSFKEMSYAEIYDPVSSRTFIGGMFQDADHVAGIVYWNGKLISTYIQNFDLRWELFHSNGQTVSISAFYKKFNHPIEIVQFATQSGSFQPRNVGEGQVFGTEIEIRQSFQPVSEALRNLSFSSNITFTRSVVELSKTEYNSRLENARMGETIRDYRDMAGQAPYIINIGLAYNGGSSSFWKGFEAGLYYNIQGPTLQYVGIADRPDIYSMPFQSLNFNSNKTFGKKSRMQIGLKIENILNDKNESVYKSFQAKDQYFTRLDPGITFSLRMGYSLF